MDCKTANNIDIVGFLSNLGHKPFRVGNKYTWYISPFRTETIPSFKVEKNRFHDFGSGQRGGTLDLAILLWNCSVSEALQKLANMHIVFSFQKQLQSRPKDSTIKIIEVKSIQSKPLFAYLWKRKINPQIGKENLKEVVFSWEGGRPQYALGFQTNSGSWELRNSILKLATSPKDITVINKSSNKINVFEGFFDYLSYLQLRNNKVLDDALVLNSITNVNKAFEALSKYEQINCYLDNDLAGQKTMKILIEKLQEKIHDFSMEYEPYKDLNEFLINKK
jgi:DNA primase